MRPLDCLLMWLVLLAIFIGASADVCSPNPCYNGAICQTDPQLNYTCVCPAAFTGADCQYAVGASCHCSGDPHCHTFDGNRHEHHTDCRSSFVTACGAWPDGAPLWPPELPYLQLATEHSSDYCGDPALRLRCVHTLILDVWGDVDTRIVLSRTMGLSVIIGLSNRRNDLETVRCLPWPREQGNETSCNDPNPYVGIYENGGFPLFVQAYPRPGGGYAMRVDLHLPPYGTVVLEMDLYGFSLNLPFGVARLLHGYICGNCGFMDGDPSNDFDGLAKATADFQRSYILRPYTPNGCDRSFRYPMAMASVTPMPSSCDENLRSDCSTVIQTSNYPNCPDTWFNEALAACRIDACAGQGYVHSTLSAFEANCGLYGSIDTSWRSLLEADSSCAVSRMSFKRSASFDCVRTCAKPEPCPDDEDSINYRLHRREMCACNGERVWDEVSASCVDQADCGTTSYTFPSDYTGIGGGRYNSESDSRYSYYRCKTVPDDQDMRWCAKHGWCIPTDNILAQEECKRMCVCEDAPMKPGWTGPAPQRWRCGGIKKRRAVRADCLKCALGATDADCIGSTHGYGFKFVEGMMSCLRPKAGSQSAYKRNRLLHRANNDTRITDIC